MNADPQFKKGRKYDQVVSGARAVFLREGFEGASVDVIARDSGVSKATLYSYFPDKQALFLAVLQGECDFQSNAQLEEASQEQDFEAALLHMVTSMLGFLLSEEALALFRVCVGEAQRFPELGRAFYETGPRTGMEQLTAFMASPRAQGALNVSDPRQAADTLMQLCRSDFMLQRLMGVTPEPTPDIIDTHARQAVRTFLARYGRG